MSRNQNAKIIAEAFEHGWLFTHRQKAIGLVLFKRAGEQIEVFTLNGLNNMTVATLINHPNRGKTRLFRTHVSMADLARIFENPRVHINGAGAGWLVK